MTSKYALANQLIEQLQSSSGQHKLDTPDVEEATLVMLVQALKSSKGADYTRGILQYELDSLGSGGVYEIARGGGHS
ncbi:MAG: hypothetical protein AAF993_11145 [Pseudomonadota bacterium]